MHPAAAAELADLDEASYRRVVAALRRLEDDPLRPRPGADVRRLEENPALHRLRVGALRVLYAVVVREVLVLVVERRGAGYARLVRLARTRGGG